MGLFRKMFLDGDWKIAYREVCDNEKNILELKKRFSCLINDDNKYWFADPIQVSFKNNIYLFCEAYDRNKEKGVIGYFSYNNGKFDKFQPVIEEEYHLSYPCVFEYSNEYYMIPESGENKTVDLYKAKDFPNKWEKVKTLIEGEIIADPTVFVVSDDYYLFCYSENEKRYIGRVYKITLEEGELTLLNEIEYQENMGRPAGCFFWCNDELYRPAQDSRELYGKSILFYKVFLENGFYREELCSGVDNKSIGLMNRIGVDRTHTFSLSENLMIIDYNNMKFDLFKRIRIINRKIKKAKRNKK